VRIRALTKRRAAAAAPERAQSESECRRGGELRLAAAAFASSAMHDVSSDLGFCNAVVGWV